MGTPEALPTILAATGLEAWALRRELRGVSVTRCGVALRRYKGTAHSEIAILCGLAGGLNDRIEPGSVAVPDVVGLPDGTRMKCDPIWTGRLRSAAASLGYSTVGGPMLTASEIVTGEAREYWARHGFVAADMEAGWLMARGVRVATVRVVLDTPAHPIDGQWERPRRALFTVRLWTELLWLAWRAPRYSMCAARIVRRALDEA